MRAQAQFTIYTLNDVVTSATAPTPAYLGQLWVDTSKSPPVCKGVKRQGCESAFAVIANIVLQRTDTAKSRLGVCRGLCG